MRAEMGNEIKNTVEEYGLFYVATPSMKKIKNRMLYINMKPAIEVKCVLTLFCFHLDAE